MKLHRVSVPAVVLLCTQASFAADQQALKLTQTIALPGVKGRIDHLSVDVKGNRLFVAALGNDSVEVVDLATGKAVHSIKGIKEPQGVRFLENGTLFVGSGEGGSCEVFDAGSFKHLSSIKLGDDADNVRCDPKTDRVYVGYGGGAIGVIDAAKRAKLADIPLKAHPESFQLESKGNRIFVNVPKAMQIAIIDRSRNSVSAVWPVHQAHENFPMALDEMHHRLFVGCRKPAKLLVLNSDDGKLITSSDCSGDTDDVFFDPGTQRVYMSCGEGFLDVFEAGARTLARVQHLPTAAGARTSLFVPELKRLYLAVPAARSHAAELRVYNTGENHPATRPKP